MRRIYRPTVKKLLLGHLAYKQEDDYMSNKQLKKINQLRVKLGTKLDAATIQSETIENAKNGIFGYLMAQDGSILEYRPCTEGMGYDVQRYHPPTPENLADGLFCYTWE